MNSTFMWNRKSATFCIANLQTSVSRFRARASPIKWIQQWNLRTDLDDLSRVLSILQRYAEKNWVNLPWHRLALLPCEAAKTVHLAMFGHLKAVILRAFKENCSLEMKLLSSGGPTMTAASDFFPCAWGILWDLPWSDLIYSRLASWSFIIILPILHLNWKAPGASNGTDRITNDCLWPRYSSLPCATREI